MTGSTGHERRRPWDTGRFVTSLALLLLIAVALPAAAVAALDHRLGSPSPFAGVAPPWEWDIGAITTQLGEPLRDGVVADALVRLSAGLVLVAALIILVTTVLELIHLVRHRGIPRPSITGLGWAQSIARYIAIGLLVAMPLTARTPFVTTAAPNVVASDHGPVPDAISPSTVGGLAGSTPHTASPSGQVQRGAARPLPTEDRSEPQGPAVHVVGRGESVWSIAAGLAGGDERRTVEIANRILDENLGRTMVDGQRFTNPAYIGVGWELLLPRSLEPTTGRDEPTTVAPVIGVEPDAEPVAAAGERFYTVVAGDTLWDIAEHWLGDGERWRSIWAINGGAEMNDGRVFDEPDLILPGWVLRLPDAAEPAVVEATAPAGETNSPAASEPTPEEEVADAHDVAADAGADETGPDEADVDADAAAEDDVNADDAEADDAEPTSLDPTTSFDHPPDDHSSDQTADGAPVPGAVPTPPSNAPPTTTSSTSTTSTTTTTTTPIPADAPPIDPSGSSSRTPIRLEHAALIAGGILALIGVRRRARLRATTPRSRIPLPTKEQADLERKLRVSQPDGQETRLDVAVRAASAALLDVDAQIGWAELPPTGDVRLQLTGPATLPPPWVGDRTRWTLPAHIPLELIAADARQVGQPCVAFTQIGVTADGAAVVLDLEACGILTIDGPADIASEITTGLALGVATSLYAETANIITVGLHESATLGHRNAERIADVAEAVRAAEAMTTSIAGADETTFRLRARRTSGEAWEPTILIIDPSERLDPGAPGLTPAPGRGLAVVVTHAADTAGARLYCSDAAWTLQAFGGELRLTPVGVREPELAEVAASVERAGEPADAEPTDIDDLAWMPTPGAAGDPADAYREPEAAVVVQLLGGVRVTARDGEELRFERSKALELVAWLATHRSNSTRSGARAALWEINVRDATFANVVSEARRGLARLVAPPDGDEWIPRTLTDELYLDHRVVTDVDLLQHRLDHARVQPPDQAIATLRPAVDRIAGMPFAGTNYLWPDAEGLASQHVLLAIAASYEFAAHALALGDIDGVFWATGKGLSVLHGHEELIGLRMRAHACAGDLTAVSDEWERYERIIVADPWSDGEPSAKLVELRHELLSTE